MFKLADNTTVDDINKVPEQWRGLYEESDGKFVMNDAFKVVAVGVDTLGLNLEKARGENTRIVTQRDELKTQIAQFIELGETPDAVKEKLTALQKQIDDGGDNKVDLDKIRSETEATIKQLKSDHASALEAEQKIGKTTFLDSQIDGAMLKHRVREDMYDVFRAFVLTQSDSVIEDGKYQSRVFDTDGKTHKSDGVGGFISIGKGVESMATDDKFQHFFKPKDKSGTGGDGGVDQSRFRNPGTPGNPNKMSSDDKISQGMAERRARRNY